MCYVIKNIILNVKWYVPFPQHMEIQNYTILTFEFTIFSYSTQQEQAANYLAT
jgi:hypothetical protein